MALMTSILRSGALALMLALPSATVQAQFAVGPGSVEATTRSASGLANDGFSYVHLMLAGLDRKDLGDAMKERLFALQSFQSATEFYGKAEGAADGSPIAAAQAGGQGEAVAFLAQKRGPLWAARASNSKGPDRSGQQGDPKFRGRHG